MYYSIEPRDRIYVKGYGFLSFAKNIGKNLSNIVKNFLIMTDAIKTASKKSNSKNSRSNWWFNW